jgi:predicted aldo/keto reductase-like oxidoreductase
MKYIKYGKDEWEISRFGMGCMRFPKLESDKEAIDREQVYEMVKYAIDHGVNYFDTAYVYPGSEDVLGEAIARLNARDKVKIATKVPPWHIERYSDWEKYLDIELERLQTDYTDVCLLHCMQEASTWKKVKEFDGLKFLDEMKKKGKIRQAAFSFHDAYPVFKEVVDAYDWDMCQIQLNYLDTEFQAGIKGMEYAHSKGLTVVAMEPLKGGALADELLPDVVKDWFKAAGKKRSVVEWAFRWLYDRPENTVIISGVSNLQQLKENIAIFNESDVNVMTDEEKAIIDRAVTLYREHINVGCTGCSYCMPCPSNVDIPGVFSRYNALKIRKDVSKIYKMYQSELVDHQKDATQCVECGACMAHCPQSIQIIDELKKAHTALTTN